MKHPAATFLCKKSWMRNARTGGGRCRRIRVTIASAKSAVMGNLVMGTLELR
jgi:hypothetical protein